MDTICTIMGCLLAVSFFTVAGILVLEAKDDKPEEKRIYEPYNSSAYPKISESQKN